LSERWCRHGKGIDGLTDIAKDRGRADPKAGREVGVGRSANSPNRNPRAQRRVLKPDEPASRPVEEHVVSARQGQILSFAHGHSLIF